MTSPLEAGQDCIEVETESILCREDGGFAWTFLITNLSGTVAHAAVLANVGFAPNSIPLVPPLGPGGSTSLQAVITGAAPGTIACTPVVLLDVAGGICCHEDVCVELPECDCAQILDATLAPTGVAGQYSLAFTLFNVAGWNTGHVVLFGTGVTVTPAIVTVPPLAPYSSTGVGPVLVTTGAAPGSVVCITLGNHSPDWLQCCFVEVCVTIPPPPCPGDLNGDGVVNGADLAILIGSWGASGVGDLNGDGIVNGADLAILIGMWGPCP